MSMELIAIISVGVALAGLILNGQRSLREEIKSLRAEMHAELKVLREEMHAGLKVLREDLNSLREEVISLRERMAHLAGLLEGLREAITGRRVTMAEAVAEEADQYGRR